jgi:hypothetical protein
MLLVRWLTLFLPLVLFVIAILSSCSGPVDPRRAGATAVAAATGQDYQVAAVDQVPLYIYGPQQLGMPNLYLKQNTPVRVIRSQLGYTEVQTEEGQVGWVPSEDLAARPAESSDLAHETSAPDTETTGESGAKNSDSSSAKPTPSPAVRR